MGSGELWDDLGSSSFVTGKSDAEKSRPSTHHAKRHELSRRVIDSSDDELDFLSSGSWSDDVEQIPTKSKKKRPEKAVIQGRYHQDYLPKRKLPNFKKITNAVPEEGSPSTSRSKTSKITQKSLKQTKSYGILATLHDHENERLPWPSDGPSSDKDSLGDHTDPSTTQREVQRFPGLALSPSRSCDQDLPHPHTPRPISFRQPKPLHNKDSPRLGTNIRSTPTFRHAPVIQSSDSSDSSEVTPRAKHLKGRLRKFPTLDPLSISDQTVSELDGGKGKAPFEGASSRIPSQTHRRTHSDMTTPRKNRKSRYPLPSPLSSPAHQLSQDSATAVQGTNSRDTLDIVADEDADDESQKRRPQLRPFPMAVNQSKATSRTPRPKVDRTQQACSDYGRNNPFATDLEAIGNDSLFSGEPMDPSSLCPFCDEKLPPNPSSFYYSLLEAARRKAYPDPRPTNSRGLKALMGIYVASCKRHRFETHQIPKAIAKGWPTNINFGKVRERVERLTGSLTKLVRDEGNARKESIYWTTVMKEVRKLGSRAASGVKGQFESFEKTQPGYYGELGSMILHQTLYNMFPPSSIDPQSITPLTPQEFIQRILVPEAALALIMEDTGQDRAKAVQTMRESAGYGVAMFPDTSEGPEVGAGEAIVIERARLRRRELEDEERKEALLRSEGSEVEDPVQAKGTKRPKMLSSATTTDMEEVATARRKMKRKKAGLRTDAESGSDGHVFCGNRAMSAYKSTAAVSSNLAVDLSQLQSSPPSISPTPAKLNPQSPRRSSPKRRLARTPRPEQRAFSLDATPKEKRPDGGSMSTPIDVDIIDAANSTSPFEQPSPNPTDHITVCAQGSSDVRGHCDPPKPKPKPRRRIPERNSPIDRRLGLNDPSTGQNQWRNSSVETTEPPPDHDRLAWRETPGGVTTLLNDNTGRNKTRARHHPTPTGIRASSSSSPKHDRHDWLMNDSSD